MTALASRRHLTQRELTWRLVGVVGGFLLIVSGGGWWYLAKILEVTS